MPAVPLRVRTAVLGQRDGYLCAPSCLASSVPCLCASLSLCAPCRPRALRPSSCHTQRGRREVDVCHPSSCLCRRENVEPACRPRTYDLGGYLVPSSCSRRDVELERSCLCARHDLGGYVPRAVPQGIGACVLVRGRQARHGAARCGRRQARHMRVCPFRPSYGRSGVARPRVLRFPLRKIRLEIRTENFTVGG